MKGSQLSSIVKISEEMILRQALNMYHGQNRSAPDYRGAMRLFQGALLKTNAVANFYLGRMFERGLGVKRNGNRACIYYDVSSKLGFLPAKFELAEFHYLGRVIGRKDKRLGLKLFRESAKEGYEPSIERLMIMKLLAAITT